MSRTSATTDVGARRGLWRSRWAAIGAAVAVSLGAGGFFVAQAAPGPSESTVVTVTPERILDTRDPNNVGLGGPFVSAVSQKLQVTGSIPTATGTKTVVPTGATGVLLNVTPVSPTADGFISIRPGDATGAATTSSLNFTAGGVLPNAVQVAVPTSGANAGKIDITYDAYGVAGPTTDMLIDVVGYMTSAGLQELVTDVAAKADAADVYTKAQVDAGFVPQGEVVLSHGPLLHPNTGCTPSSVGNYYQMTRVSGDGCVQVALEGPGRLGTMNYGLKSVTYCFRERVAPAFVTTAQVYASEPALKSAKDETDRSANGCYTLPVNDGTSTSFVFSLVLSGGGQLEITSITSTWAPPSALSLESPGGDVDLSDPGLGG